MDELTIARETKQPLEYPSCGSVFKRPPGMFAGKLIQDSGLQGTRIGGAEVSKKHAGFIVNVDNATATEYMSLVRHVQQTVKNKFGVDLETEVITIGEDLEEPVSD
jgi:UDP-N-acetylmuramate dehydrogenase